MRRARLFVWGQQQECFPFVPTLLEPLRIPSQMFLSSERGQGRKCSEAPMGRDSWCGSFNKAQGTQGSNGDLEARTVKGSRGSKDTDNPT